MNVRAATAQDAAGIVALHKTANPYGDWFRNPLQRLGRVQYEDLTPLERYLHGGFGMDLQLFRRHLHEYQRRGFPTLVAEEAGRIVGECEVWLDEEPDPFGRYAAALTLASGVPPSADVERELLQRAADRVRKMGYAALDLPPQPPGGQSLVRDLGFRPLWDIRAYSANPGQIPKPEEEFTTRFLAGESGDLRGLLLLGHREPAHWRYETLTALWPAAQIAGLRDALKLVAVLVAPEEGSGFAVLAARREWLDPPIAEVDVWVDAARLKNPAKMRSAFSIAVEVARKLGCKGVETHAPPIAAKALRALGFTGGDQKGEWLRWTF